MPKYDIPLARPNLTNAETDAVVSVLQTPYLSLGPRVTEFEEAFAQYCKTRYAVSCSSGTAGLHMLVTAMHIGQGDEVITTPFSFVASANCALMAGADIAFADIDPETWCIDPKRFEEAITENTKAVIPVDVFGVIADMDSIIDTARRNDLRVLEDSCEALGSVYRGKMAGAVADAGVFGFYPNKQMTTGEGGMIVTDDEELANLCRSLRNQGRDTMGGWLVHPRLGFNYRMCDINAALGTVQLSRIESIKAERTRVQDLYRARLADEKRILMQRITPGCKNVSWFVFVIRLDNRYSQEDRDKIIISLREMGIGAANYFAPIHLQPFYMERYGFKEGDFPVCEALAARSIALPFHHQMNEEKVDIVCTELQKLLD